jgi:hypothetical protein
MTANTPQLTTPDTIVLIHGLWMTSLSWEHWIDRYEARVSRKRRWVVMKRVVILIVLVLVIVAASIDCIGFGPGIYGVC